MTLTAGFPLWSISINGEKGILVITNEFADKQCVDDAEASRCGIPRQDRVPEGVEMQQHTWNRLAADFVTVIRSAAHSSVPHPPAFGDGLRAREVVAAARRSAMERRWVELDEIT
jgi:predicted dehydrogenase